jgi:hypothetical protein
MERFNFKKLNKAESKEQHRDRVLIRFAASEHLNAELEINSALEMIRENKFQPKRVQVLFWTEEAYGMVRRGMF